jgi:aldehyde dehydrogenase (NAD+)
MYECRKFYIDGEWIEPLSSDEMPVIDPATEKTVGIVALGNDADVDRAVAAARRAFDTFSRSSRESRLALLNRIDAAYAARYDEIAEAITAEMGSPITLSKQLQAATGTIHIKTTAAILADYPFASDQGTTRIVHEAIGVCGLITPWNWPINQIACKLFPALAAGCTVVLKPSELTPVAATLLAEVMHEADTPQGVFNLVHGTGPVVGQAISRHPDVEMVSFTGSTRAGREIATAAAPTIKRVTQELGGKSANILVDDDSFAPAIQHGVASVMLNCGQSCAAPTRLLVPQHRLEEAASIAADIAAAAVIGDPRRDDVTLGPLANAAQFEKVQRLIQTGIDEGATVAAGGTGRPAGCETGYYVRPTIFTNVSNDMTIAREEIFGPVLCIIPYQDEDDAVRIANDSDYGLSGYVTASDRAHAGRIAERLRTGSVFVNGADLDPMAPLGGYKQSGNGREWGIAGLEEYLETKSIIGYAEADGEGASVQLV